mgnify:CR=1 FL=1
MSDRLRTWWSSLETQLLLCLWRVSQVMKRPEMSRDEVAQCIQDFLDGTGGPGDWDDFTSSQIRDPELESVRKQCFDVYTRFPAAKGEGYCNAEGLAELRRLLALLRSQPTSPHP